MTDNIVYNLKNFSSLVERAASSNASEREAALEALEKLLQLDDFEDSASRESFVQMLVGVRGLDQQVRAREIRIETLESEILQKDESLDHINNRAQQTKSQLNEQGRDLLKNRRNENWKTALFSGVAVAVVFSCAWWIDHNNSAKEVGFWQNQNLTLQQSMLSNDEKIQDLSKEIAGERLKTLAMQTEYNKEKLQISSDYDARIAVAENRLSDAEIRLKALTKEGLKKNSPVEIDAGITSTNPLVSNSFRTPVSPQTTLYLKQPGGWMNFRWGMNVDGVKKAFKAPAWRDGTKTTRDIQACSLFPNTQPLLATEGKGFGQDAQSTQNNLEISFCFAPNGLLTGVSTTMKKLYEQEARKVIDDESGKADNYQVINIQNNKVEVWAWYRGPNQIEFVKGLTNDDVIVGIGAMKAPETAWTLD